MVVNCLVLIDGKEYGPISTETLRKWANEGRITRQSLIKRVGGKQWVSADKAPGLFPEIPPIQTANDPPEAVLEALPADEPDESGLGFLNRLSVPSTLVPSSSYELSGYGGYSSTREYRRTCKRCGAVWHSLVSRERKVKRDETLNNCQVVTCDPTQQKLAKANLQSSERELDRLRKCPNCQSSLYDEELL
jgi:hypothetical protein